MFNFATDLLKMTNYQISSKSVQWDPCFSMRKEGKTDEHHEANSRLSQLPERGYKPVRTITLCVAVRVAATCFTPFCASLSYALENCSCQCLTLSMPGPFLPRPPPKKKENSVLCYIRQVENSYKIHVGTRSGEHRP